MKNSYRFFSNYECKFFPCHEQSNHGPLKEGEFNCLFCYCPLYILGDKCGGLFENRGSPGAKYDIKDCTNCYLPHMPEYYDVIVSKLGKMISEGLDADIN